MPLRRRTCAQCAALTGTARYDGHTVLDLRPEATAATYHSAIWHHDRCGRRLKLFVFLDSVDSMSGRPTLVARGTHNILHFFSGWPFGASRYADQYVHAHHDIASLDAPRGGGFLLDTNALHRAALERGGGIRRAVVLEFHGYGKVRIPRTWARRQTPSPYPSPSGSHAMQRCGC